MSNERVKPDMADGITSFLNLLSARCKNAVNYLLISTTAASIKGSNWEFR